MANWLGSLLWSAPVVSLAIHGTAVDDDDDAFAVPLEAYTGTCYAINSAEPLTGTITIDSRGSKFHHNGIDIVVVEYLHFLDPFLSFDLSSIMIHVADEGSITGVSSLDFSVTLPLEMRRETYNGTAFSLRHRVEARVKQSWYNSDIYRYQFLYSFAVVSPPTNPNSDSLSPLCILLQHPSANLLVTSSITSLPLSLPYIDLTLTFTDVSTPITNAYILLLSGEFLNDNDEESVNANVELVHQVFGLGNLISDDKESSRSDSLSLVQGPENDSTPLSKGYMTRKDVDVTNVRPADPIIHETRVPLYYMPTNTNTTNSASSENYFEFLNPADWPTTHRPPTLSMEATVATDGSGIVPAASLKYYLRVVMEDAQGKRVWDAQEIVLYRDEGPSSEVHAAPNRV